MREVMAKHNLNLAERGERDEIKLSDSHSIFSPQTTKLRLPQLSLRVIPFEQTRLDDARQISRLK